MMLIIERTSKNSVGLVIILYREIDLLFLLIILVLTQLPTHSMEAFLALIFL